MKVILLVIILFCFLDCFGQKERHIREYFKNYYNIPDSVKLKKFAFNLSKASKDSLIKTFLTRGDSVLDPIYLLDLNGDKYPDLFTTNSQGTSFVLIFFGSKNGFKPVLDWDWKNDGDLGFKEFILKGRKCETVILFEEDVIGTYYKAERLYKLVNDSFVLQTIRKGRECTFQSKKYYNCSILMKTINDSCTLRENPKYGKANCVIREEESEIYGETDNQIG